ncbi:hypothetical protein J3Q64DRAFT_1361108 [Phycomyces blakesleeanus]|uniref:Ndc10 domain-containing protein n=1 Tax=Phycomyces blakesleeanus TaxID=4837 RepID=A0ABR3AL28_PHYBL
MLDNVFARLKQEIAIDGARGTCIDDVWAHVKVITTSEIVQREGELSTPVNIDMAYKCYVWRFIRRFPELLFYEKLDRTGQNEDDLNDNNSENDLIESSDNSCDGKVRPFTQLKAIYIYLKKDFLFDESN